MPGALSADDGSRPPSTTQTLHSQSLNSPSGPPPELSQTVDATRELSTDIKQRIKTVNTLTSGDKGKKAQVKGVKEQFMGLLQEYQSVEKMHRSKVKQRAERQFKIGQSPKPRLLLPRFQWGKQS